jgi:hypothetical protein
MTISDFESAPAWTKVMASISVLNQKTYYGEYHRFIYEMQTVEVVLDDSFVAVLLLIERMPTMFFPIAVTIQVRNDEPVYESGQRGLVEKNSALFNWHG